MIQKTDLRIGNKVALFDFTATITHLGEGTVGYNADGNKTSATYELLKPIPLTPEILEKCGFFMAQDNYVDSNGVKIFIDTEGGFYHMNSEMLINLYHVHQLQNWYYFNVGEELSITL